MPKKTKARSEEKRANMPRPPIPAPPTPMSKPMKRRVALKPIKRPPENVDFLETDIDRLFRIIESEKKLSIKKAAKRFKVPENKIEEWGTILEENGLIEMDYPTFGKPVMKSKSVSNKNAKKQEEK